MNFKILLLKILMLLDFLIYGSRLFKSFIAEGKKEFSKKSFLSEVGEYFLRLEKDIWYMVRGLVEKDISVTGCYLF